jgi:RNA polymerase sigma-70 factor (ECF subfamily)
VTADVSREENVPVLVDHLFRREAGRMVSYLTRIFGLRHLNLAEDVVQDTLCQALLAWPVHGLPDNPSAWLMRAARNRAIDIIRRDDQFHDLTPELTALIEQQSETTAAEPASDNEIRDDQLRMMFSLCHPELSIDMQVTLILKTLCGFSVAEIASALLTEEDTIEKRLGRARKFLRESGKFVQITDTAEIPARLEAVYQAIYLLFNEGYHGSHSEQTVRDELCYEALRLGLVLCEHPESARPKTFALLALFCLNAARLSGRMDAEGSLLQLADQDRSKWDAALIGQGFQFLSRSAAEDELSEFHLEAAIASLHSGAPNYAETNWSRIRELYDLLYELRPTPIVALNRAIAVGNAEGPEEGLAHLARIARLDKLKGYPFLPAAQGEFQRLAGRPLEAQRSFENALALARNATEARFLEQKLADLAHALN